MQQTALRFHREEQISTWTHAVGLAASITGAVILIDMAARSALPLSLTAAIVYCTSLILVYLSSTLYHASRHPGARTVFQVFDHCAIYLLIAGTYTPLCLLGPGGAWGWSICAIVWAMALAGIVAKLFFAARVDFLSTALYLMMGWLGVVAAQPFLEALTPAAAAWVVAGGLAYTAGTVFFASHRIPYAHAWWHLFVLAGSGCHFAAIASQMA